MKKTIFLFFTLLILSTALFSQNNTIKGFVYEKSTGEPVMFASVFLKGTTMGSTTDENGYFIITRIPKGEYTLVSTFVGYDTVTRPVSLNVNDNVQLRLILEQSTIQLEAVSVSAEYTSARTDIRTSVTQVTPKLIKQIPTIGGQADFAQYLQVLPGVVFTGDQGGQLYIRGGSPIQNKVLLDGMVIYNPFHSIGLFSVFETDLLRTADVHSGGFSAEHGGRISAVMDLKTRDGNKQRLSGKVSGTTFGANLLLEGPFVKQDESHGGTSFLLSYKNSYLEQSSKVFYKYIDEDGLPYNFDDLYGKVSINTTNGSKINFFGFNFADRVKYKALSDFSWNTFGGGTHFVVIPGISPVMIEGSIAYSNYAISMDEKNNLPRSSKIDGFSASVGVTSFVGKDEFKAGVEMQGFSTDFVYYNAMKLKTTLQQYTTEVAPYVTYRMGINKFLLEPGIRLQYYASHSYASFEPRFALKYLLSDKLRLKLASGIYSQNFLATSSDREVVNLFYGFLSGPRDLPSTFDGKSLKHKIQKAEHIVVGAEYDALKYLTFNIEGYYKNFSQLINLNRNKIYNDIPQYSDKPEIQRKDFIVETGRAYGLDVSLKYDHNNLYIWGAYSLSWVDRYDGMITYAPHYDRRHNVTLLGVYKWGEFDQWEVNLKWNFGSGFPFTQNQGNYEQLILVDGISSDFITENGKIETIYADYNKGRLSDYHRLDFGLSYKFIITEHSKIEVAFSLTNVYNRKNIFYVERLSTERIYQLPIMPSLGLAWTF
ncbi:MAG: TonB-dependent receptor [Bacteroidales bacterium]|jgi:hypothetical protein